MISLCREVADRVSKEVAPLVGKKEAGDVLYIGADGSPTKRIDKVAEDCTISTLVASEIPMIVISEEAGRVELSDAPEYICLLDPIDGTYNAVKDIPFFSLSIAFARFSEKATLADIEAGFVMNLATGEEFTAVKGRGARHGEEVISSSKVKIIGDATFSVYHQGKMMQLCKELKRTRTFGSVALELCHAANGSLEGVVDLRGYLKTTDIAAGKLILEEAGGMVTDSAGKVLEPGLKKLEKTDMIACGSAEMHGEALKLLEGEKR